MLQEVDVAVQLHKAGKTSLEQLNKPTLWSKAKNFIIAAFTILFIVRAVLPPKL